MTEPFEVGPPPHPLAGRQRRLVWYLRGSLALATLAACAELLVPPQDRPSVGRLMVAVLVLAPVGRVAWLGVRWARRRDWRFTAAAAVLLAVVAASLFLR